MLALSDAGLRHLADAIAAVPHEVRARWLRRVARHLEARSGSHEITIPTARLKLKTRRCRPQVQVSGQPSRLALKQRRHRARRKKGQAVLVVTARPADAIAHLRRQGCHMPLDASEADIEAALSRLIAAS